MNRSIDPAPAAPPAATSSWSLSWSLSWWLSWWFVPGGVVVAAGLLAVGAPIVAVLAAAPAVAAAAVDARTGRIPNAVALLAGLPAVVVAGVAAAGGSTSLAGRAAVGVLLLAGPLFVAHLLAPGSLGLGDVKLGAALGGTVGAIDPRLALPALAIAAGVTVAAAAIVRRSTMPFAPGLVVGAFVVVPLPGSSLGGQLGGLG